MTPEEEKRIRELDDKLSPGSEYVAPGTIAGDRRMLLQEIDRLREALLETMTALDDAVTSTAAGIHSAKNPCHPVCNICNSDMPEFLAALSKAEAVLAKPEGR